MNMSTMATLTITIMELKLADSWMPMTSIEVTTTDGQECHQVEDAGLLRQGIEDRCAAPEGVP